MTRRPTAEIVAELRKLRHSPPTIEAANRLAELDSNRATVVALVVAVDRYVDHHNEGDEAVCHQLWRTMTSACDVAAEAFKVYPL